VIAIDTNVLVRLIVQDDPAQAARASAFCDSGVIVSLTVALETEWVLRSRYGLDPVAMQKCFNVLFASADFHFESVKALQWALERYVKGADFADMIHLVSNMNADGFGTFDASLNDEAGAASPIPIVLI
jgi:predicted nucleic-acid-binding protein